jgi:hypothetical protein
MGGETRWILLGAVAAFTTACPEEEGERESVGMSVTGATASEAATGGSDDTDGPVDEDDTSAPDDDDSTSSPDPTGGEEESSTGVGPEPLPPFDPMCEGDRGGGGVPGGNGEPCDADTPCAGGVCYEMGILGGACGECSSDADCVDGGCTPPDLITDPIVPSVCNGGEQGAGCESDEACCGIGRCGTLFDIPGIATARTCGHCTTDADCPPGGTCQPDLAFPSFGGVLECVLPGSLPLDHACDAENAAVAPCDGVCRAVDVGGLTTIGICGECASDADCDGSASCLPGTADFNDGTFTGSRCG